jgi:hypothetical protein
MISIIYKPPIAAESKFNGQLKSVPRAGGKREARR